MRPEFAAEQDIDFGRYGRAVVRRWWLVLACVIIGALIGYFATSRGEQLYEAKAIVYLGQPLSPNGGAQIPSLATNALAVSTIVRSPLVGQAVAEKLGIDETRLEDGISTGPVRTGGSRSANLVTVTVRGPWEDESAEAANLLAKRAVADLLGTYTATKIEGLKEQLAVQRNELNSIQDRITAYRDALDNPNLTYTSKLLLVSLAGNAEQRRGALLENVTTNQNLLKLAQNVEASRILIPAVAEPSAPHSKRTATIVGALIGFVVGVAAALLVPPLGRVRVARA
jgi:capsular polysaccharide biosynthesis protein